MPNKLQELTDKLYKEGLSKGKEEGERILEEAQKQAAALVENARAEADAILAAAHKEAADRKAKTESDLKMASAQCLQATRKDIENLVVTKICSEQVSKALSDPEFLKETITEVAKRFSATEAADIALVLPEKLKTGLEPWVAGELSKVLGAGVSASFSKKIAGGFTIGPADGSYFVNLTDESFSELIGGYLRPVTRKLLFGE